MINTIDNRLPRSLPEQQGIASSAIREFVTALDRQHKEVHSLMLLRHGSVVAEGWWTPYAPERPHSLFSVTKSFTSTAVGFAAGEGHLSIDDPVIGFFPEAAADVSEHLAGMTVRHLLTMTTGHAQDTWPAMEQRPDMHWLRSFFELPVLHEPGTHFVYNTGASYVLAAVVEKVTATTLIDYLTPRLFAPLGIENPLWDRSPEGITIGGFGLSLRTEDVARFGQLYLQKGLWNGQRVVAEAWIDAATSRQVPNGTDPHSDWNQGYGYQFWRCRHGAYRGDGVFGQYCVVMPQQNAVLAMTGALDPLDMQGPLDLFWEIVLPAMVDAPLEENPAAHQNLTEALAALGYPPVEGKFGSPIAERSAGKTYRVEPNPLNVTAISFHFTEAGCTVTVKSGAGEDTIPCGYGRWQAGHAALYDPDSVAPRRTPIIASAAWTADDALSIEIRLHETPFTQSIVCHFAGDELIIESLISPTFGTLEKQIIVGSCG